MTTINNLIDTICFELSVSDRHATFDYDDSSAISRFIERIQDDYGDELRDNNDAMEALNALKSKLKELEAATSALTKEELKSVYLKLKSRELHPMGEFDKMGRFYLKDSELVSCRAPSTKYPYSQMNAGRTGKFVKAIADKYACKTVEELESRFNKA